MRDRLLPALMAVLLAASAPAMAGQMARHGGTVRLASAAEDQTMAALMPGFGREARIAPLPQPLSAEDAARYRRVMQLQNAGEWAAADHELAKVGDALLKGHMLVRRFLAAGSHARYQDLRAWMADYADLPEAEAIYHLATARGIKGFGPLRQPVRGTLRGAGIDTSDDGANWEDDTFSIDGGSPHGAAIKAHFRRMLRHGKDEAAIALFTSRQAQSLKPLDLDQMKLALALDRFADGRDAEAAAWASQAAERSGDQLPAAHWVAGLAEWRMGQPERARRHFEEVAQSSQLSGWMVAAGAFWAARANLVSHRPEVVDHWLEIAATYPRTFYGLMARRILGYETLFSWENVPFTETDADTLLRVPGTRRALGLLQIGDTQGAEEELRKAYPRAGKAVRQSMLAMAQTGGMPSLAVRLGGMNPGQHSDSAAFPVPEWNPKGGWTVDRALVYAFIRQESSFNPRAHSAKGAGGLMQVMPATATAIAGRHAREHLNDPAVNLAVGQRYLARLLSQAPVRGNLLYLAAAYNAGPGKLSQWLSNHRNARDPLLFIETLPSRETRTFVERVMTNFWIYRARLQQPSTSLDEIAAGGWPMYESQAHLERVSTR